MPCLHLLISGKVQGVWFRESMKREAERVGASGWVRNLADGRVEAVVCGEETVVEDMRRWAETGPPLARVDGVESASHAELDFRGFEKR